nr:GNAT family protein [uncultured Carboxylicivirga sp.]
MKKLILRPWKAEDLKNLVTYANNWNIAKFLTNQFPHPYTIEDGKAFVEFANRDQPVHIFAIVFNDEAIGGVGIHPQGDIHIKNAELGYWIGEPFWGQGIVSKAVNQIINFAFTTYDIDRIYASVFGSNLGSQKVLQKNNFKLEARFENTVFKKDRYEDEIFYGLRREDWENAKRKI